MAENKAKSEKHGVFGGIIKVIMVIIFFVIGVTIIALGSYCIAKNVDHDGSNNYRWLSITNIVCGCLLLTSPFFLSHKRGGLNKVIQIIMVIAFMIIGLTLIIVCSVALAKGYNGAKWFPITNLVLGCLLFTSPFFLKKDL